MLGAGCAISLRFLAEFTLNTFVSLSAGSMNVLGMTLRLGSGPAFQVRLRSLP